MTPIDSLMHDIDAAVFDDASFDNILRSLTECVRAQTSTLWLLPTSQAAAPPIATVHEIRPDAIAEFAHYWYLLDPWSKQARRDGGMPSGLTAIGSELVERTEVERSAFYNEWGREHGMSAMLGAVVAGPVSADGPPRSLASFYRRHGEPEFDATDKALLQQALPRLQATIRMRDLWRSAVRLSGAASEAFDQLDAAAFMLDDQGRILHANKQAQEVLCTSAQAAQRNGRLVSLGERLHPRLSELLAKAVSSRLAQPALVLWAGPPPALCRVRLLPLRAEPLAAARPDRLLLVAERPDAERWLALAAAFYGLTPAQTRVLQQLLAGLEPSAIAERLGLRLTTVRTHVRQVMNKLAVSRATDVVRLLSGLRL